MTREDGFHTVQFRQMTITSDGWLTMLPFNHGGVTLGGVSEEKLIGTFEAVDFGNITPAFTGESNRSKVDEIISPTFTIELKANGTVRFDSGKEGRWLLEDDSYRVKMTFFDVTYEGVVYNMKNDSGKTVTAVSLLGSDNSAVWCVK